MTGIDFKEKHFQGFFFYVRSLNFCHILTQSYPLCARALLWLLLTTYPKKWLLQHFTTKNIDTCQLYNTIFLFSRVWYLVCCMTPGFVCVMIGSKKEIGTTLIDFLSNLVRCMCVYVRADSSTIPDMILFFHPFQKLWMHTYMEILTNRVEPTLWKVLKELVCGHK